jgi:hypothetical protein
MELSNMADEIHYIPLEKLSFDPHNPRLPSDLVGRKDEEKIIDYMLRDASLLELMRSIGESDYYRSEPLLVVPDKDGYIVVEGNRRLAALKLLSNPHLARVREKAVVESVAGKRFTPTQIPCILHKKRDDVLDYLGYRHITGVKSWGALEKARYLAQLQKKHKKKGREQTFKTLAKMIGSRADYVGKLLAALMLYDYASNKAYFKINITEKDIDFSILSTAIGYNNIYIFIGLSSSDDIDETHINDKNFEFLFKRLYDSQLKIKESRELSDLSDVLGNPRAMDVYRTGVPLSEAIYYTHTPVETLRQFLVEAKKSLTNARNCLDRPLDMGEEFDLILDQVKELQNITKSIRNFLQDD